jgi:hypothetical protein
MSDHSSSSTCTTGSSIAASKTEKSTVTATTATAAPPPSARIHNSNIVKPHADTQDLVDASLDFGTRSRPYIACPFFNRRFWASNSFFSRRFCAESVAAQPLYSRRRVLPRNAGVRRMGLTNPAPRLSAPSCNNPLRRGFFCLRIQNNREPGREGPGSQKTLLTPSPTESSS